MPRGSACKQSMCGEWLTPLGSFATHEYYRSVQEEVIAWWRQHQRQDLPWRQTLPRGSGDLSGAVDGEKHRTSATTARYDPYQVWVSEVMSQQTRMETVIPYYVAWMKRFPSIEALAASTEDEVKSVWAGMGYYRRAMYLRKGAKYLLERSKEKEGTAAVCMPSSQEELLKVPGIGPYTSAAITSMCFGKPVCSVDGNVIRVLSRLRGARDFDPKVPANVKEAAAWGQRLMGNSPTTSAVVCQDPSALNQGLMELGASVCRPSGAPLCTSCPLQRFCRASALLRGGDIEAIEGVIPVRAAKMAKRSARKLCVVHEMSASRIGDARRFVVVRRPANGLLGGMLEFPTVNASAADDEEAVVPLLKHPLSMLAWKARARPTFARLCGNVRHIFSHIVMDVGVAHVQWPADADGAALLKRVAEVVDDHCAGDCCNELPTAARIFLMSEADLRENAPSRLMLKVLQKVSSVEVKQVRTSRTGKRAIQESSDSLSPHKKVARGEQARS
ncbi:putative A/G-specific adenine glycosylase [Leishmania major strain Friedlin]|uniref:Adenine DNA glycosylase n=1 Tax=Leishmania major TaxID=5664 RepID=Q4Q851_LEIMA|nr:putative A/G-specific adenine glycosylase [Leishmania major strain Friedlin]CAG9577326.1 A/G-specific_adenine_glycosylase_-_putative [Leishmania major strain Friedlin]CAJ05658.1 putative A/G-specific adenine glycosylase [Leishmania major strain Friedlin]|eukprot:XP_001684497.1 putative A/G-specific adenine glycosylase [Leishmania major strain Friedlin]